MTTYSGLIASLNNLSIAGVTNVTTPPVRINAADLPIGFPRLPEGSSETNVLSMANFRDDLTCEYIVIIEPRNLNVQSVNYALATSVMDALNAALKAESTATQAFWKWDIRMDIDTSTNVEYWAVSATVRGWSLT